MAVKGRGYPDYLRKVEPLPSTVESEKKEKQALKPITVEMNQETIDALEKIQIWYRSPSRSHTIRIMIDDVAKGIENGDILSRFRTNL